MGNDNDDYYWVELGRQARGLVQAGAIVAVVYWAPADVGEYGEPGGEPVLVAAGYYLVDVNAPADHICVVEGDEPSASWDDDEVLLLAADEYARTHGGTSERGR
jgi:hypothetical protein